MSFNAEKRNKEAPVGPARRAGRVDAASSPRRVKLGEVCRIVSLPRPEAECIWLLNLDMVEQQTGCVIHKLVVDAKDVGASTVAFDDTCVLYSKLRPNLNKVVLPDEPGVATSELLVLKNSDGLCRDYLCWFLRSPKFVEYAVSKTAGAKMPRLGTKQLFEAHIPLPPLPAQRKIAAELDRICELKRTAENLVEKYQQLVKSRFVEMFGEGNGGLREGRAPSRPRPRQSAALPSVVKVADVCSIITDGTHQPPKFVPNGIPFLFVSNIVSNKITYDAEKFINEQTYAELIKRTPIERGDLLLSTVGSYGHPAIVREDRRFLFQRHIAYLKPRQDIVDSQYLHGAFLSPKVQEQIERKVKGIAQKTLNLSEIRSIEIPLPPLSLQRQFAAFVAKVDKLEFAAKKAEEKLDLLYRSKLQEYFG